MYYLAFPQTAGEQTAQSQSNINDRYLPVPINRNQEGIGFRHAALQRHTWNPNTPSQHSSPYHHLEAYPSNTLILFSWNAGNLERFVRGDVMNQLCSMPSHHIALFQEADHHHTSHLCRHYAIAQHRNIDHKLAAHAGGTGIKVIRPLHDYDRNRYANGETPGNEACWTDYITRPGTPQDDNLDHEDDRVLKFSIVDICSFHPVSGQALERGGKTIWRCASVHYNAYYAKPPKGKPSSVQKVLGRLIMICLRES